jgi:hypothetical protein
MRLKINLRRFFFNTTGEIGDEFIDVFQNKSNYIDRDIKRQPYHCKILVNQVVKSHFQRRHI